MQRRKRKHLPVDIPRRDERPLHADAFEYQRHVRDLEVPRVDGEGVYGGARSHDRQDKFPARLRGRRD